MMINIIIMTLSRHDNIRVQEWHIYLDNYNLSGRTQGLLNKNKIILGTETLANYPGVNEVMELGL